jgi:hypothetical protein
VSTYRPGEEQADREQMLALHTALNAVSTALSRHEHSVWQITGKRGHILTWGDGESFLLYVQPGPSSRRWNNAKRDLPFCEVTQDGDGEGCLRLRGLPSPGQAAAIRDVLNIWRRPAFTPEYQHALRERGRAAAARRPRPLE